MMAFPRGGPNHRGTRGEPIAFLTRLELTQKSRCRRWPTPARKRVANPRQGDFAKPDSEEKASVRRLAYRDNTLPRQRFHSLARRRARYFVGRASSGSGFESMDTPLEPPPR